MSLNPMARRSGSNRHTAAAHAGELEDLPAAGHTLGSDAFAPRELQPCEDRVELDRTRDSLDSFREVIDTMADFVAWAQPRSESRVGSADADARVAFGTSRVWRQPLRSVARRTALEVVADWEAFVAAGAMPL